jgi:hypothetical protein
MAPRSDGLLFIPDTVSVIISVAGPVLRVRSLRINLYSQLFTYSSEDTLYLVDTVRDLGVKVSSDLSWSTHIGNMVSKARSTLSWLLSVFKTCDKTAMTTLCKSVVRSLLVLVSLVAPG